MVVKNPLFNAPRAQGPGRPRLINWSRDGLPNPFIKVYKDADRRQEKAYVKLAANSKKYQMRELAREASDILSLTNQDRLDKLLKTNPTTIMALDRFTRNVELLNAHLSKKMKEARPKHRPRKDPSANSSLGAYWKPTEKRRRRAPARLT
jgi:hypothetical protein